MKTEKEIIQNLEAILKEAVSNGIQAAQARLAEIRGKVAYVVQNSNGSIAGTMHDLCGFSYAYIPCGVISRRSKIVKALLAQGLLSYDDYRGALHVRVPYVDQGISVNEAASEAVVETLKKYGIEAYSESRLD